MQTILLAASLTNAELHLLHTTSVEEDDTVFAIIALVPADLESSSAPSITLADYPSEEPWSVMMEEVTAEEQKSLHEELLMKVPSTIKRSKVASASGLFLGGIMLLLVVLVTVLSF